MAAALGMLALLVASAAGAPAAGAQSTADRGTTKLTLASTAAKRLARSGVAVRATRPATRSGRRITLPVERGTVGTRTTLEHGGSIAFRRRAGGRTRTVVWRDIRATLGTRTSITAVVGGKRRTVLTSARRKPVVDRNAATARLKSTQVTLTAATARLMRRTLRLSRLSRSFGTVVVDAALRAGTDAGTPTTTPLGPEPEPLARPASAVTVREATVQWHVRESWIRYLAASAKAAGNGTIVADGAVELPPSRGDSGTGPELVYDFSFPFRDGWAAGDVAALRFGGSLTFTYPEHGNLEVTAREPEIELSGSASRAIFRFAGASIDPSSRNRRAVLLRLDPAAATRTQSPDGRTVTYERIPAWVAEGAESGVFAGLYMPGAEFGWMTVSYTTP
jgi:hypothetical protein